MSKDKPTSRNGIADKPSPIHKKDFLTDTATAYLVSSPTATAKKERLQHESTSPGRVSSVPSSMNNKSLDGPRLAQVNKSSSADLVKRRQETEWDGKLERYVPRNYNVDDDDEGRARNRTGDRKGRSPGKPVPDVPGPKQADLLLYLRPHNSGSPGPRYGSQGGGYISDWYYGEHDDGRDFESFQISPFSPAEEPVYLTSSPYPRDSKNLIATPSNGDLEGGNKPSSALNDIRFVATPFGPRKISDAREKISSTALDSSARDSYHVGDDADALSIQSGASSLLHPDPSRPVSPEWMTKKRAPSPGRAVAGPRKSDVSPARPPRGKSF